MTITQTQIDVLREETQELLKDTTKSLDPEGDLKKSLSFNLALLDELEKREDQESKEKANEILKGGNVLVICTTIVASILILSMKECGKQVSQFTHENQMAQLKCEKK